MLAVEFAVFAEFQLRRDILAVFLRRIVAAAALFTLQSDQLDVSFFLLSHLFSPENPAVFSMRAPDRT